MRRISILTAAVALLAESFFAAAPAHGALRRLAFVEAQFKGLGVPAGLGGAVTVSPDGGHVYTSGSDNALAVFGRNATTGALTFVEVQRDGVAGVDGLEGPTSITMSPDGKHVYVTGNSENAVAVFTRNTTTGALSFVEVQRDRIGGVEGLTAPQGFAVSPEGTNAYVAGVNLDARTGAVAVFSRDSTTGRLTFVEAQTNGVNGVDGLAFGAGSVTVSPDGTNLYASGSDAVAVFRRNATTGALTFVGVRRDGVGGVDGLLQISSIAVSLDGRHLYVAGADDNALAVFSRNATTGALTFVEVQKDGAGGVEGLEVPNSVTVSPDGGLLYATGAQDNTLVVFTRNAATGALTFAEVETHGARGVWGLSGPNEVVVSPDGLHVYVGGGNSASVAVFRAIVCGNGVLDPNEQCDDGNLVDGDGCDSNCTPTGCGNGIVTVGEQCDDGNVSDGDSCRPDCLGQPFPGLLTRLSNGGRPGISADSRFVAVEDEGIIRVADRKTGTIESVSVSSGGSPANAASYWPAISGDGRFVAFSSTASNLVAGDTNGVDDVFVHDRQTGATERVSVDSTGGQGDAPSGLHSVGLSADGRFVAFESRASNLAPGDIQGVGIGVLVHDRATGTTERVGLDSSGSEVGSDQPTISGDARYVAFRADVRYPGGVLVPDDTNGAADVFVRDRLTGAVERVSVTSSGDQANDQSFYPVISPDGRYVLFESIASNLVPDDTNGLPDVFIHDRQTETTERMSVASNGAEANFGAGGGSISADGRYVTFQSYANNLILGDLNGGSDYFMRDRVKGTTERESVDSAGRQVPGAASCCDAPALSADGRFVVFVSEVPLAPGDTSGVYVRDRGVTKDAAANETVTTDWAEDGATLLSPVEVAVRTPNAGTVSIAEATGSVPAGFSVVGVQAQISAPAATSAAPLMLVFTIDVSAVPGQEVTDIDLFKNGAAVPICTGTPGMASPDPCVTNRRLLLDGDVEISVLTSSLSVWASGSSSPLPIRGSSLTLRDDSIAPINVNARKIKFRSSSYRGVPSGVTLPASGGVGDPTSLGVTDGGAILTVYNDNGTGEKVVVPLSVANWRAAGSPPSQYKYRDPQRRSGPIAKISVKNGKLTLSGRGPDWLYTLDNPPQGVVAVRLQLGTQPAFCAVFPAKARGNPPSTAKFDKLDKFVGASNSPPPSACPPVP